MTEPSATNGVTNDDLTAKRTGMTIVQLKQELKKRKLKTAGLKSELIRRLLPFMQLEREHGKTEDDNGIRDNNDDKGAYGEEGHDDESDISSSDEDETPIGGRRRSGTEEARRSQLLTFRDVEDVSLETFNGDDKVDVKRWIKDFEEMAVLCEWSDIQKVVYAKRLLRGSAKLFVNYERCTKTWKKLRRALKEEFANVVDSHAVHQELSRRRKTSDESYQAYIYKMLEIAAQADVDTRSVIRYVIEGVQDEAVNKTILHGAKTIRELKERFAQYEAIKKEGKSRTKQPKPEEKKKTTREDTSSTEARRCFNCGSRDHLGKACPMKDRGAKCFKCNQYGHIAKLCKEAISSRKEAACVIVKNSQQKKQVEIANQCFVSIIDTGSDLSLINRDCYEKIGCPKLDSKISFDGLGARNNSTDGSFVTNVVIDGETYEIVLHVIKNETMKHAVLIGADFLNLVELHSIKGQVMIKKVHEESTNANKLNIPEILKIDMIENADPFDFSYISDKDARREVETIANNYQPAECKTNAVMRFSIPRCIRDVQSFIGLTDYFRKFIYQYSLIARPLTNLLRNNVEFRFGIDEQQAFQNLKLALSNKPVLKLYNAGAETELHTDASRFGYGAILLQRDYSDNAFHPVYYASGKTTLAEEKYTSYELEVLAVVKSLKKFRVYLLGIHFKIITHCRAFTLTMNKKYLCVRVARWALALEEYDYEIQHRPGKNMMHVDALSRNPLPETLLISENNDGLIARFKKAQSTDQDLQKIIKLATLNKADNYIIRNKLLYRDNDGELLLVVPKILQTSIIRQAHKQGHFGNNKTEVFVHRDYWFKGIRPKIKKVIRGCINILAERKQGKQEGFLNGNGQQRRRRKRKRGWS